MTLPTGNNPSLGQKKRPLSEECGVSTTTSEGRRGLQSNHRQGRERPRTPTPTPVIPCSKRLLQSTVQRRNSSQVYCHRTPA